MNRAFSVYLDLIRFVAAFLVFVYHSNQRIIIEAPSFKRLWAQLCYCFLCPFGLCDFLRIVAE